jgi:uncharacterized protein (DUF2235 family)
MGRNIAICSDGTSNTFEDRVTNVTRLVKSLVVSDERRQLVMYDQGVGTTTRGRRAGPDPDQPGLRFLDAPLATTGPVGALNKTRGLLFGYGLKENVGQMYRALAEEYEEGDALFLFGFSRGAFTVRALAGLLHRCWMPPADSDDIEERFERAWQLFQPMKPDRPAVSHLRAGHRPCPVHFLGVWDTVKSYGGLTPVILPHLRHNPSVAHVRHALALDETRAWFKPTTWGLLDIDREGAMKRLDPGDRPGYERQVIEEVWFRGSHSDVGGGSVEETAASRITLRWMLTEATSVRPGLFLDEAGMARARASDAGAPTVVQSRTLPWRLVEQIPRWEIENSGKYPKRVWHRGGDGRRDPAVSRRDGKVKVHETAGDPGRLGVEVIEVPTKTMAQTN